MYHTNSTVFINGKNINKFIHEELIISNIHKLIQDALKKYDDVDIESLNDLLITQLEKLLSHSVVNKGSPVHNPNEIAVKKIVDSKDLLNDITCIKCKRPCKTKAALCDFGSHWIHYNFEKLTNDIQIFKSVPTAVHHCKICKNNNNPTVIKTIPYDAGDHAIDLLEEETQLDMNNRGGDMDACKSCKTIYDKTALQYEDSTPICYGCIGTRD
ncbi:unnamed protein product [Mytilus coruscus]|uniref:Uncharacterized protein n=1 Tax=Mytilus coruscus TaxID=42192 RepID=A0A6J8E432_MYTCO|nr:unnamed protein product [Mytilus coruscus]